MWLQGQRKCKVVFSVVSALQCEENPHLHKIIISEVSALQGEYDILENTPL